MSYIGNRPFKCVRRWIGHGVACLVYVAMFMTLPAIGCWMYGQWIVEQPGLINIPLFVLCAAALVAFGWYGLLRNLKTEFQCRVVPYFTQQVASCPDNKLSPFSTGMQLASRCRELDQLATEAGVPTLSSFGFRDDRDWQRMVWHPVEEGLRTVEALLSAVGTSERDAALCEELVRLRDYLRKGVGRDIQFCLIVRVGLDRMISPLEMERRIGHFW